jgi:Arc/MetJ family transcription regulator
LVMYACAIHHQHSEADVAVTQIDLDDEALAEVMRIAGVHTKKDAVNLAMRDYVERFRRIEALARSREHAKGWDYEGWLAARADEKAVGT